MRVAEQVNGGTWSHMWIYTDGQGERVALTCDDRGWIALDELEPAVGPDGCSESVLVSTVEESGTEQVDTDILIQDDGSRDWLEHGSRVVGWQPIPEPMRAPT